MKSKELPPFASFLFALYLWPMAIFFSIVFFCTGLIFLPLAFLGARRTLAHQVAVIWARSIMAMSFVWRYSVHGTKNIQKNKPYVIVANHQSLLDIFVVLVSLPLHFKFIAKKELFAVPFIGWHMFLTGYIPVDRASAASGKKAFTTARNWLERGVSILFFPEGTRSLDGRIHEFKSGAFKMAQELGIEILPVVISGTGEAIPKKSKGIKKTSHFDVEVGKPVRISKEDSIDKIKNNIRDEMIERLEDLRRQA